MARQDALIKLFQRLVARRRELTRAIVEDLEDLQHERGASVGLDDADVAADAMNSEMTSQLAQLESRELAHINHAIARLRSGRYGMCEACNKRIPVARLNALPYTTLCIACQREQEAHPERFENLMNRWEDETTAAGAAALLLPDMESVS